MLEITELHRNMYCTYVRYYTFNVLPRLSNYLYIIIGNDYGHRHSLVPFLHRLIHHL